MSLRALFEEYGIEGKNTEFIGGSDINTIIHVSALWPIPYTIQIPYTVVECVNRDFMFFSMDI